MISLELSLKLKEADFPQVIGDEKSGNAFYIRRNDGTYDYIVCGYPQHYTHAYDKDMILVPNLSELIEACGNWFENLTAKGDNVWCCNYHTDGWWETENCCSGSTPEEAVANLWLALNKSLKI